MSEPDPTTAPASATTDEERAEWWLNKVLEVAEKARAAGVTSVRALGFEATFVDRPFFKADPKSDKSDATVPSDGLPTLDDPASYPGGVVPGFTITRLDAGEE